jgi:transcriptional regulator with XRE-family HTH domain
MGSITQNIRDIMSLKGISQKELAQRLGMSPSQLSAIFNADPEHNFTIKTLRRFAAALDVDLDVRLSDRNAVRHDVMPTVVEHWRMSSLSGRELNPDQGESMMAMTTEPAVTLPPEVLDAVAELRHIRSEMSTLRGRESDVRAEILQALGDSQQGLTGSGEPVVKIRLQHRRNVNAKQLEALYPDVYDEVMSETVVKIVDLP